MFSKVAIVAVVAVFICLIQIHAFRERKRRQALIETGKLDKRIIALPDKVFDEFEHYADSFELISKYALGDSRYRACLYAFKIGYAVGKSEKGGEDNE